MPMDATPLCLHGQTKHPTTTVTLTITTELPKQNDPIKTHSKTVLYHKKNLGVINSLGFFVLL